MPQQAEAVRWVTPLMMVGTAEDARAMGSVYVTTVEEAVDHMVIGQAVVVPTRQIAAEVVRQFGGSEEWVQAHVLGEWAGFRGFEEPGPTPS